MSHRSPIEGLTGATSVKISWYGAKFHGQTTANGEIFDMYKISAAHRWLPFGTKVLLYNPASKTSVVVEINDRGPFVSQREYDVSCAAAKRLHLVKKGVANVFSLVID